MMRLDVFQAGLCIVCRREESIFTRQHRYIPLPQVNSSAIECVDGVGGDLLLGEQLEELSIGQRDA